jgi:hypothetical protein
MTLRNQRGAVLIVSYIMLFALMTMSAGLAIFNFNEINYARRYTRSVQAFWLAESWIHRYLADPGILEKESRLIIDEPNSRVILERDDSHPEGRRLTASATVQGVKRSIRVTFPVKSSDVFNNTFSVNGNILIGGQRTAVRIDDKTRMSGSVQENSTYASVYFEDKKERVHPGLVSLSYPDTNQNGQVDEFSDFVQFHREQLAQYPQQEVLYLQGNGTYTISAQSNLQDKKFIYVEGEEGQGNVVIPVSGMLQPQQKITIISTGKVTVNVAGLMPDSAQLNVIAWSGYKETAAVAGTLRGTIYTHGQAVFDNIYDTSLTYGNLIANEGVRMGEIWSTKLFQYADIRQGDAVPAGFEGMIGGGTSGYVSIPDSWKDVL